MCRAVPCRAVPCRAVPGWRAALAPDWISPQHLEFAERNAAQIRQLFEGLE
jgi:hypothetical protein